MHTKNINPTIVWPSTDTPPFRVGDVYFCKTEVGSKAYMFVQDSGAGITGNGYAAVIDGSAFTAVMVDTTTSAPGAGQGKLVGIARAAIAANGFGWLQIFGPGLVRVAALAAAYTTLNTTANAGELDDDAGAGSEVIEGIVLDAARGASAGTSAGWLNWPRVSRTL